MPDFPDQVLMQFVDGELDDETAAVVESAMNNDEILAARVAVFSDTRKVAKTAFNGMLQEAVPSELQRSVEQMVERRRNQAGRQKSSLLLRPANDWWWKASAAASVAIALGVAGYWVTGNQADGNGLMVASVDNPALVAALSSVPSGGSSQLGQDRFRAIASLRDSQNALCREFEIDRTTGTTESAIACRDDDRWAVRIAVAAPANADGYAPASSIEALDAYATAIGAVTLSPSEEKAAMARE